MQTTPILNQTLSGSGSIVLDHQGEFHALAEFLVAVEGEPTGPNPQLLIMVSESIDGVNYPESMGFTFPLITGKLPYKLRKVVDDGLEKLIRISWQVSEGASFSGVSVYINSPGFNHTILLDGREII